MRHAISFVLLDCLVRTSFAAHPLVTEDTGTQGTHNQQIEINTDNIRQRDIHTQVGTFTYAYGANDNLDLFANLPATFSPVSGMNDTSLGMKWRFLNDGPTTMALKPEWLLPTGNENRGLGTGRSGMALTWVGGYAVAPFTWYANVAMTWNRYRLKSDEEANQAVVWRVSTAVWYALNDNWRIVGDTGISRNPDKTNNTALGYVLTGITYSPNKNTDLDAGIKAGIGCSNCPTQVRHQIGVGLTSRF